MSKARNAAISELGKEDDYINLKGFNTERTNLQNTYNTDYNNLQNAYNNLLSTAEQNKISAGKDFVSNRNVVDASDYMATRGRTGADLSSRGLSKGFGSAGRFATNLQRNQANSNIANTYYNAMADIQKDIDTGTQTHNYNMESLKNQLDKGLAEVAAREAAARNNYRALVAQLAEQKQARYDANAYAEKQYQLALDDSQRQYASGFVTDEKQLNDSGYILDEARKVVSQGKAKLKDSKGKEYTVSTVSDALKWLEQNDRYRMADVQAATKQSWENLKKQNAIDNYTNTHRAVQAPIELTKIGYDWLRNLFS